VCFAGARSLFALSVADNVRLYSPFHVFDRPSLVPRAEAFAPDRSESYVKTEDRPLLHTNQQPPALEKSIKQEVNNLRKHRALT
jgi:hypothetical protein